MSATISTGPARRRKASAGEFLKPLLGRLLNPRHLWRALRLRRGRKAARRVVDDSQLQLYHRILGGDFLHYGYFDDPRIDPQSLSLEDLRQAQRRYAEQLLEQARDRTRPVLDVGCGMGGLLAMLAERGFEPVALTPDRSQLMYVGRRYPDVPQLAMPFEDLDGEAHRGRYGTVITSESLQYLELDRALPLMQKILAPEGRWIACDYFRIDAGTHDSGHVWSEFERRAETRGWRLVEQRDITPNVLPSLRYLHMWGADILAPAIEYFLQRVERRDPGLYYLAEHSFALLRELMAANLQQIDPQVFAARKRYLLLVLQR